MAKKSFDVTRKATYVFQPEAGPSGVSIVGIDDKNTELHPLYDPRITAPITDDEIANVISVGIVTPIIVAKRNGVATVIDGRQRVRRAREANILIAKHSKDPDFIAKYGDKVELITVEAKVLPPGYTDAELALMGATGNIRVEESMLSKAERAKKIMTMFPAKMVDADKYRHVAQGFGVSETAVRQWLSLVEAAAPVRRAVERGDISATAAAKLAKAGTVAEQTAALDEMLKEGGGKATVAKAQRASGKAKSKSKAKDDDVAVPAGPGRGKRSIKKALARVLANKLHLTSEQKDCCEMALLYAMGDDLDGEVWEAAQDDKVLRALTGRAKPGEKSADE